MVGLNTHSMLERQTGAVQKQSKQHVLHDNIVLQKRSGIYRLANVVEENENNIKASWVCCCIYTIALFKADRNITF